MTQSPAYGPIAKTLHWLIVALLVLQYAIGWWMPGIKRGMSPGALMNLHMSIGTVILGVMLLRLAWRVARPVAPETGLPQWQRSAAHGLHLLLYALVVVTTLTGWVYASRRGWPITVFGLADLPPLVAEGSPVGRTIGEWHGSLIWVLLGAVGAHLAAALFHLLVAHDRVMQRMLPARRA